MALLTDFEDIINTRTFQMHMYTHARSCDLPLTIPVDWSNSVSVCNHSVADFAGVLFYGVVATERRDEPCQLPLHPRRTGTLLSLPVYVGDGH